MFARHITMYLKPDVKEEAEKAVISELPPLLKKHEGFRDVVLLVSSDGREAVGISLWDSQEAADAYHRESYPVAQSLTSRFAEKPSELKTYEVSYTSTQKNASLVSRK
jgi:heme-degrading monooxygenase HmoA